MNISQQLNISKFIISENCERKNEICQNGEDPPKISFRIWI